MMYQAAAFAMILPLLDLHCAKNANIEEIKTEITGTGADTIKKRVENINKAVGTGGDFATNVATLKTEVGNLTGNASLTAIAKAVTPTSGTAADLGEAGGIAKHDDLDAVATNVTAIKALTDKLPNANVGAAGGLAQHDSVAKEATLTPVATNVTDLKAQLTTGAGNSNPPTTIHDEIFGTNSASIKSRVAYIKSAVAAMNTDVSNINTDVGNINTAVATAASDGGIATGNALNAVAGNVNNIKTAVVAAAKYYAKVTLQFSNSGKKTLIKPAEANTCESESTSGGVEQDLLCCESGGNESSFKNVKYTEKAVAGLSSWELAQQVCNQGGLELCSEFDLGKLATTATDINQTVLAHSANIPTSLINYTNLTVSADAADVTVWTNIRCYN